jgi:GTP-binding protein
MLEVPVGTIIRRAGTDDIIADLVSEGIEFQVARGGKGGRGNAAFATATNQAPRNYEIGGEGEELDLELELKLLADVGLVGLPNAGKSTLISVISAAKPKIADYPFTTLTPNLGIVRVAEAKSFVVADIPGLIEGAHQGKGLGTQFLRHIERTRILAFLLDATSEDLKGDYAVLLKELRSFNATLTRKPKLIVLTKMDLIPKSDWKRFKAMSIGRTKVLTISAVSGEGVHDLIGALAKKMRLD